FAQVAFSGRVASACRSVVRPGPPRGGIEVVRGDSFWPRCTDARAERVSPHDHRSAPVHHRPGPLRPPSSVDAGEPADERVGAGRTAAEPPFPALLGDPLYEGVRPGGNGPSALAPGSA